MGSVATGDVVMRLVLVLVLAGLVALPLSANAQAGEEGTNLQEPAPSAEPAPQEPALQLQLDDDSVKLAPGSAWADEGYVREGLERKARKTRNALIGTSAAAAVGWSLFGIAHAQRFETDSYPYGTSDFTRAGNSLIATGMFLGITGLTGAFITGIMFGVQKGQLRRLPHTFEEVELRAQRKRVRGLSPPAC